MTLICGINNEKVNKLIPQQNIISEEVYDQIHEVSRSEFQFVFSFYLFQFQLSIQNLSLCSFLGRGYNSCNQYFTPIILDEGKCYTFNMLNREEIFRENV